MDFLMLLQSLGFTPLNIVLVVMVYFMGAQAGIFPKLWKSKEVEVEEGEDEIPVWAQELTEQMNHAQTDILKDIRDGVKKLDERGEMQCKKMDKLVNMEEDRKEDDVEWRREVRDI